MGTTPDGEESNMLRRPAAMLAARSLRKAYVPPSLLSDTSPGSRQPTRLAVHDNAAGSSCSAYFASGCRVYKIEISMEGDMLSKGKESLLIPINAETLTGHPIQYHLVIVVSEKEVGPGYVAVARELCKCIDIYDQDIHVRSLRTLWYPSSFSFAHCMPQVNESGSMLAIAEGSQLSIWDLRMSNNGGCIHRISGPVGGIIYSVCSSPSGLVAVGGTDRTVTIYDPRRWTALSRWVGCSKYEAFRFRQLMNLSFMSKVLIMRLRVDFGRKVSELSHFEGTLTGWCANTDVVAGWCESGSVFVADVRPDSLSLEG
uniref:Uncharacterized protein n=1 Tax=Leersia perrieri TaxID=77586 RepID=A0A0D9V875_9ORYZ